jgi:hypothetical protein
VARKSALQNRSTFHTPSSTLYASRSKFFQALIKGVMIGFFDGRFFICAVTRRPLARRRKTVLIKESLPGSD